MNKRTAHIWVGSLVALAALVCTIGLGRPSLWIDETHSFEFSALPSAGLVLLNAAARDAYPPLYFLFLHAWMFVSRTEVWLRLSSVLFHLASIPLIYLIGARLVSTEAGVVAAALLAINPFHLAFATEARMYAPVEFLSLWSMWGLIRWLQDRSATGYRIFLGAGLALLYTHFMGALVLIAQAAILVAGGWGWARVRAGAYRWALVIGLCFLPWFPLFLKAAVVTRGYGSELPVRDIIFYFLSALGVGFWHARWALALAALAVTLTVSFGIFAAPAGRVRRLLALWAFIPVGVELGLSAAGKPVFGERTLISATPAWLLLMACLLTAGPRVFAAIGAVLLGGFAGLSYAHVLVFSLPTAPAHREALNDVLARIRPGDAIVHSSTITYHPVHEYYLPRSTHSTGLRAGATVYEDFLVEPQGEFHAGKFGTWSREMWRKVRDRLDPAGAIHTGSDPHRVGEEALLARRFRRIWYFHEDTVGTKRLWYLMPSMLYSVSSDRIRDVALEEHPKLGRAYRREELVLNYPGLAVELYRRR